MKPQRIVIAGGSGFIGRVLAKEFAYHHSDVVILTRTPRFRTSDIREVAWDGKKPGDWAQHLCGADALINLTGKNINCPHTLNNLRELTESRVDSVHALAAACGRVTVPPRVWVQASATGFYGDSGDAQCDEHAPSGQNALADICRRWEDAFTAADVPQTRKATLRIGFVLGQNGGALPLLTKLAIWGLGGRAGNGRQYLSWIHLYDLVQMFRLAVERDNFAVSANAVAPNPVTNAEFMRELRRAVKRPWSPPVPALAVKLGAKFMKSEPALVLTGQRCVPCVFQELEFLWRYPQVYGALEDLCRKR